MATALIGIRDDGTDRSNLFSLENSMSSLAESNGERIDRWLTGEHIQGRRGQDALYVVSRMQKGDSLYVESVSSLGSSMSEVLGVLTEALKRGVNIYGVEDGFSFDRSIDLHSYLAALEQAGAIYNSIISSRTKAALDKKRREGAKLGRPVGSDGKMKTLQRNRAGVLKAINSGMPYMDICRKYKVSFSTLRRFREAEGLLSSSDSQQHVSSGHKTYFSPKSRSAAVATRDLLCQSGEEVGVKI